MAGHSAQGVVRVSRKPKTASETEIVRLITATNERRASCRERV